MWVIRAAVMCAALCLAAPALAQYDDYGTPPSTTPTPPPATGEPPLGTPPSGTPGTPTTPGTHTPTTTTSSATGVCTISGPVLTPTDFNVAAGQPVADVSTTILADGRIRIYAFAQGQGIRSAVSVSADGLSFVPEAGSRLPDGNGMPRIVGGPVGGYRLFFTSGDGIRSATSADGLTFTIEAGFRISKQQAGFADATGTLVAVSGGSLVALADGRYRMYFSTLPRPGETAGGHRVKSAVSVDMLTWEVEPGILLGAGAATLTESAEHPFALAHPNGSVTLYYGKFGASPTGAAEGLYQSTSTDGRTFTTEALSVFFGNDPDLIRRADGTLLAYYGGFDPVIGGTVNVATCPDPAASVATSPTPAPSPAPSTATITITSAGASPQTVTIAAGGRVTFVNNDTRSHDMSSDPHPTHTDCSAVNQVGFLTPGQSRETGNLTTVRTCGFHDHDQPSNSRLQGQIIIQ